MLVNAVKHVRMKNMSEITLSFVKSIYTCCKDAIVARSNSRRG